MSLALRLSVTGIVGLAALSTTHWLRKNMSNPPLVLAFALGVMPNLTAAFAMPLLVASWIANTSSIPVTVRSRRMYFWVVLSTTSGLFGWELIQTRSSRFVFDPYDILATGLGALLAQLAYHWHASGFEVSHEATGPGEA